MLPFGVHISVSGLSPRGRGNQHQRVFVCACYGSIPAWAGKPRSHARHHRPPQVYPRVGGETIADRDQNRIQVGLSPRGRGNHAAARSCCAASGSIPAWAGKPGEEVSSIRTDKVYPRVGGETLCTGLEALCTGGLSPRGRGNLRRGGLRTDRRGSIPAWAGKPFQRQAGGGIYQVYPRVGGETGDESKR